MVKDTRKIQFDKGVSKVYFTDVASTIETETVMFTPNNQTGNITIYEQNFENNLAGKYSILKNFIGKDINIDASQGNSVKNVNGQLLSYTNGFLLQTNTGVNIYDSVSAVRVPQLPEGLLIRPTLVWVAFSLNSVTTNCEIAYRASGISWKSDYMMVLNQKEDRVDLGGWVTIDNNSGKKYTNTKLKLIAGSNNDHIYPIGIRVNLNESSRKQIEFLPKVYGVNVNKKTYFVSIDTGGYSQENLKFQSKISFLNSKNNRMGIPLPAGTVRVFKKDQADGSLEFIGESNIRHTPRDENVTVTTGNAFDLVGKLTAISRTSVTNGYDATMQLNVTNRSGKPADMVLILTNYNSDNNALKGTTGIDWTKISANMFEIRLTAAANETKSVGWTERHRD